MKINVLCKWISAPWTENSYEVKLEKTTRRMLVLRLAIHREVAGEEMNKSCCKIYFTAKEINWVENVCNNFACGYLCRCVIYFQSRFSSVSTEPRPSEAITGHTRLVLSAWLYVVLTVCLHLFCLCRWKGFNCLA